MMRGNLEHVSHPLGYDPRRQMGMMLHYSCGIFTIKIDLR